MKIPRCFIFGFSLATSPLCLGQVDIYQSDAYSLEEMCAREAEQNLADYANAYDACIEKNRNNPMYSEAETQNAEETTEQADSDSQEINQDLSQDQVVY